MHKWQRFWIAELQIDPSIEAKLRWEKGFSSTHVREIFVANRKLHAISNHDATLGLRWYVSEISEKLPKVVCVVVPVLPEFSIWKLVTAFETSNPRYIGR